MSITDKEVKQVAMSITSIRSGHALCLEGVKYALANGVLVLPRLKILECFQPLVEVHGDAVLGEPLAEWMNEDLRRVWGFILNRLKITAFSELVDSTRYSAEELRKMSVLFKLDEDQGSLTLDKEEVQKLTLSAVTHSETSKRCLSKVKDALLNCDPMVTREELMDCLEPILDDGCWVGEPLEYWASDKLMQVWVRIFDANKVACYEALQVQCPGSYSERHLTKVREKAGIAEPSKMRSGNSALHVQQVFERVMGNEPVYIECLVLTKKVLLGQLEMQRVDIIKVLAPLHSTIVKDSGARQLKQIWDAIFQQQKELAYVELKEVSAADELRGGNLSWNREVLEKGWVKYLFQDSVDKLTEDELAEIENIYLSAVNNHPSYLNCISQVRQDMLQGGEMVFNLGNFQFCIRQLTRQELVRPPDEISKLVMYKAWIKVFDHLKDAAFHELQMEYKHAVNTARVEDHPYTGADLDRIGDDYIGRVVNIKFEPAMQRPRVSDPNEPFITSHALDLDGTVTMRHHSVNEMSKRKEGLTDLQKVVEETHSAVAKAMHIPTEILEGIKTMSSSNNVPMKAVTYVYGTDIKSLSKSDLISCIKRAQDEIKALEATGVESSYIKKQVKKITKAISVMTEALDS